MTDDQPWTIGRLLTWTTDFLRERGADNPRLDAEVLLAYARECARIELYTAFDEPADEALRTKYRALVRERAGGAPVAYIVGSREFFSLPFEVTPDVLIPRPETEQLVVRGLDILKQMRDRNELADGAQPQIADVGVGSGVLAVCLAKHMPGARVTAVDVSAAALEAARRNADRHGVASQIEFLESDVLSAVADPSHFDLIVSNPPYVTTSELEQLDEGVKRFEPAVALDGGPEGTTVIARLIDQALQRLHEGGWLIFEISPTIAAAVERLMQSTPGLSPAPTLKDLADLPRVAQAQRLEAR